MNSNAPIGIFDSGLGGLTCVKKVAEIMPGENIIYFGDTGRVPYGTRSRDTIVKYVRQDINFLKSFDIKFIIIACGILEIVFEGAFFGYAEKNPLLKSLVSGFFEVTAGVISCRDITGYCSVIAAGAIASFSGISVIFQIAAVTDESKIPLFPFILSRFFHSGITALILKIFLLFSGKSIAVLSFNGGKTEAVLSASAPAAVSLLCMAALFLLSVVPPKSEKEPLLSRIWHKFEKFWHSQTR